MLTYRVDDMTCGHCARIITKAVQAVDAGAKVQIDLGQHLVAIERTDAAARDVAQAISEAGYTPVVVEPAPPTQKAVKKTGCCGCCV